MKHQVFVYCDEPTHPNRKGRVAVTNFVQIEPAGSGDTNAGRWNERRASRATEREASDSGTTLVDNVPWLDLPKSEQKMSFEDREVRSGYALQCRKCGPRLKVVAREETLFGILDVLAAHGVSEISLSALSRRL